MPAELSLFATTVKELAPVLADELRAAGARAVAVQRAGVAFRGPLEVAYRACMWSRVANRILLPLAEFAAPTPQALYDGVRTVRWWEHVGPRGTIAVDCAVSQSALSHSHFAALKTKDAIVDQFRARAGERPSVAVSRPNVRVNVYVHRDRAVVSIDLSGESLHRRNYRERGGAAPLKENLAAAMLMLADWPRAADGGAPFVDPMCGSGTLPIEAGLMAAHIAPGRLREYFGFVGWRGHQPEVWRRICAEAAAREVRDRKRWPVIHGYDASVPAVRAAIANVERAGLHGRVHIERRALEACAPPAVHGRPLPPGVLAVNPPYGERLGDAAQLSQLYAALGDILRRRFTGWSAYVLTGNRELAKHIGLRAARRYVLFNGAIECRLLAFPISTQAVQAGAPRWRRAPA